MCRFNMDEDTLCDIMAYKKLSSDLFCENVRLQYRFKPQRLTAPPFFPYRILIYHIFVVSTYKHMIKSQYMNMRSRFVASFSAFTVVSSNLHIKKLIISQPL